MLMPEHLAPFIISPLALSVPHSATYKQNEVNITSFIQRQVILRMNSWFCHNLGKLMHAQADPLAFCWNHSCPLSSCVELLAFLELHSLR